MNINTMELNMDELEQVNGGFSFDELLVKVAFFLFKPSNKDGMGENTPTDLKELVVKK